MIYHLRFDMRILQVPLHGLVLFGFIFGGLAMQEASADSTPTQDGDRITIGVGMPAAAFLAREIGRGKVDVIPALPEGSNHEFSSITPKTISRLLDARIFLTMGLPFERQIADSLLQRNPQLIIVSLDEGIQHIPINVHTHDQSGHTHSSACHTETTEDPHIWMNPLNMIHMAHTLEAVLRKELPSDSDALEINTKELVDRLQELHKANLSGLRPLVDAAILTYHPAFGYYAQAYGLNQISVESEGKSPSARNISDLLGNSREGMVRCMFIQPQFDTPPIRRLATRLGLPVEVVDPLSTDYPRMIEHLTTVILNHYSQPTGS